MFTRRAVVAALCVAAVCVAAIGRRHGPDNPGARPVSSPYSPIELASDRRELEAAVREGLASLHKYRSPTEVDSIFRALAESTSTPLSAVQFWRLVSVALSALHDAHLSVSPSDSLSAFVYRTGERVLPAQLAIEAGRLYVQSHYSTGDRIPPGTEIQTINGQSAADFLSRCASVIPSDGSGQSRGPRRIERDFELTCGLAAEFPSSYVLETDEGRPARHELATITWAERRRLLRATYPADTARRPAAELSFNGDSNVAILALRSFSASDAFDPGRFIDSAFARIKGQEIVGVVLDLRDNTGGSDKYASQLLRHIARDTFTYYTRRRLNKLRFDFVARTDDWLMNYMAIGMRIGGKLRPAVDGVTLHLAMDRPMKADPDSYAGPVVLLVNGNSVSTSSEFASVFRNKARGLILGEESGSSETGGGGAAVSFVLTNTGLVINIPIVDAFIARSSGTGVSANGVIPDVSIGQSIADRLAKRDPALDSALAILRHGSTTVTTRAWTSTPFPR